MGLLKFFRAIPTARLIVDHRGLIQQLSENKAKGLDDIEAGALLVTQRWKLSQTNEILSRATLLSTILGENLINFLGFSKRIGAENDIRNAFISDPFYNLHGYLYATSVPLTDIARKHMNKLWNKKYVNPADLSDSAFAAYYTTFVTPFAVDARIMLAELKKLGFCPKIDERDHIAEGIKNGHKFLETATNVDPEFSALLNEGVKHLTEMSKA